MEKHLCLLLLQTKITLSVNNTYSIRWQVRSSGLRVSALPVKPLDGSMAGHVVLLWPKRGKNYFIHGRPMLRLSQV